MKCFRKNCNSDKAICKHTQNGEYYCVSCARKINETNPNLVLIPKPKFTVGNPGIGFWKYVRVNGQYRWIKGDAMHLSHKDCVLPGEKAESAGTISVNEDNYKVYDHYSMSLKVSSDKEDQKRLPEILGVPEKERY